MLLYIHLNDGAGIQGGVGVNPRGQSISQIENLNSLELGGAVSGHGVVAHWWGGGLWHHGAM